MNKEIIDYILKSREVGQSDEQIKENLLKAGWINENIDRGFNLILIQNFILKSKGEGLKDKQIIENLIISKYDKNDIYDAYDYLVKKLGRKIMPRYYILWMPFFHRLRYRADIHYYIFKKWGFLNPFSGKLVSTKTPMGKLIVGIALISIVWLVYRSLSIPSTISSIQTELSRMSGGSAATQTTQTAITSPITESTTKSGWKVYTNSDYKFSIQLPCRDQNREMCLGGMSSYGSNYETDMVFLSTKIGLPDIRITIFSDEDIKKYNNKLVKLGYPITASSFYYSLPKMYEALNLSPGQSCQIFDENNRYYSEISYRQCLVTIINGQKSLQLSASLSPDSYGNITYLIPRGGTLWLEIIGLDNSYMKELLSNLSFTSEPLQNFQSQIIDTETSKTIKTISPIPLTSLEKTWLSGYQFWVDSGLSFNELSLVMVYKGTPYSKYKNDVYYNGTKLSVDSTTFQVLGSCGFQGFSSYAKDKNNVYRGLERSVTLSGVDVPTFELIGSFDIAPEGAPMIYCVTKDKNCIYHSDEKVLNGSGLCINPINCTEDKLASGCGFK